MLLYSAVHHSSTGATVVTTNKGGRTLGGIQVSVCVYVFYFGFSQRVPVTTSSKMQAKRERYFLCLQDPRI